MKRALGACVLILAMGLTVMAPASAAQLVLTGGQHPSFSASARCDDAVAVTTPTIAGTSSSVQVSGIAACTGNLFVRVYDTTGVSRATGSATVVAGGGSQTLTVSPAYVPSPTDKVSVTIGTWPVAATWSYTALPYVWCTLVSTGSPGSTCTATVTLFHGVKPGGSGAADYYDVVVTTTSTTPVRWEVTFNLAHSFYGSVPAQLGNSILDSFSDGLTTWNGNDTKNGTPPNDVTTQGTCSAGLLSVRGSAAASGGNDFRDVTNNRLRKFSLVANQAPAGYGDVLNGGCA
jgi:hypothetical protein